MKKIKILLSIFILASAIWLVGCAKKNEEKTQLANPASVKCQADGYQLDLRTTSAGGQLGVCQFPDGTECEEWAYFRGECQPGDLEEVDDPAVLGEEIEVIAANPGGADSLDTTAQLEDSTEVKTTPAEDVAMSPGQPVKSNLQIMLFGSVKDEVVSLFWSVTGGTAADGYKVLASDDPNPTDGQAIYHYIPDSTVTHDDWHGLEVGQVYYFKVCEYSEGRCAAYSDEVQLTIN